MKQKPDVEKLGRDIRRRTRKITLLMRKSALSLKGLHDENSIAESCYLEGWVYQSK